MTGKRCLRVLHLGRFHHDIAIGGGIQRHVATLLAGLSAEIEVDNLVAADGPHSDVITAAGYQVYRVPCYGRLAGTALAPALVTTARRLQRQRCYDIIHAHFPDPLSHLAIAALPGKARRVVTWHSDIVRQRYSLRLYRPWLDRFLAKADAVIVSTPTLGATARQLTAVPAARRHVIPFGLDYQRFLNPAFITRAKSLRAGFCGNSPLVLAVGRHVYYKGFEFLLAALARLPDAHLALVGVGPLTNELRLRAAQLGIARRVLFTGRIDDNELAAWYHACDVFCLPSVARAETFGLVQLEAMACAKPIVSTRLGTGVDYVNVDGVTGFLVPPRDVDALADALARLINDHALAAGMGQAALQRVRSEFSLSAMVSRTLALYRSLVQE